MMVPYLPHNEGPQYKGESLGPLSRKAGTWPMTMDTLHTLSRVYGSLLPWELYLLKCLDGDLTDL